MLQQKLANNATPALMAAVLLYSSIACAGHLEPVQQELNARRQQWQTNSVDDYSFRFQRLCFCLPGSVKPRIVSVLDGEIASVRDPVSGQPLDSSNSLTVNALFDEVQTAIDFHAHEIVVDYDDIFGYPASIDIDFVLQIADEEMSFRVGDLKPAAGPALQAGDSDMDYDFDQVDLLQVQIAAKYRTGQDATWGEGDWNGAPGGGPGDPPPGDGFFDQWDIIAALGPGHYLAGPYAAIAPRGSMGDEQTTIVYNATTGEVAVDAPASTELTSINIDSATAVLTGDPAENLGGSFDNDADTNIFKATFGSSFGSLSFGNVAQPGLSEDFLLNDLTVVGSLAGGGDLGDVDLIYVPEPTSLVLLLLAAFALLARRRVPSV